MSEAIKLTMDGTLLNWLKNVGDAVNSGDIIAEVEADKATVEVEAPSSGVILKLNAKPGDELKEGAEIATIGAAGESGGAAAAPAAPVTAQAAAPVQAAATNGHAAPAAASASVTEDGRVKASPLARNIAADKGINLALVQGSGPSGRIVKADVEKFNPADAEATQLIPAVQAPVATTTAPSGIAAAPTRKLPEGADVEIIDISRMRARIAVSTIESKQQIPHFYVTTEIDIAPMMALREQLNASLAAEGIKISVNDLIVKAAALTLQKYPNLNTHYYGDKLVRHKRINIGIAVALPNGGLINVVARDADKTALSVLAVHNKEMIGRAREGKVKPEDIQGATFTTSNLGPFDVEHFIAIINPPEAGIIAIGTGKKVPVVKADGTLGVGERVKITISVDHRVSDGAEGAAYLQALKALLENPMRLAL